MTRKLLFSLIISLIIIVIAFGIWIIIDNYIYQNSNLTDVENNITNTVNISTQYINDDCINELENFAKIINEDVKSASNIIINENTRYLVKNIDGYIHIFYLDSFNNEALYKTTDISTDYLSAEDLDDLEIGIEVIGSKQLNQLLEDFE